ncbi:DUF342 domain-containing protein [Desulfospira joergensenii]|uniref:DUF342 domain-containing protein n=1 Tax=Desulfospira joergensenii TaxID=53329 RepID=UPI0003B413B9|nr:FapA family protein [Desulfospira joergensenii]
MVKSGKPIPAGRIIQCQTALVTRIALFLKILSKENFQRLMRDAAGRPLSSEGQLLKLMVAKGYISPKAAPNLKKTCLNFAKAQKDTRFGSLCIEFGFLNQSNLKLALEEQKELNQEGRTVFIGNLLVDAGMISEQQQKLILQKQKMDQGSRGSSPDNQTREIREKGIVLFIPENELRVYAIREDKTNPFLNLSGLKDFLDEKGIIYGIAKDSALEEFLSDDQYTETWFELARGLEPVQGTDTQIFYMFEQDYLSPGKTAEDGSIDYKARGKVPFVKAGDVLAEKVPGKLGNSGLSVFGKVMEAEPPFDTEIQPGKGVYLSGDELSARAETDGYPKLSKDGILSVNDAHVIQGDVDFTTGHITFSKNVIITGTIKNGFRVEAKDVVAKSVDGGIIHAKGDVTVANGITNSRVNAEGSVSAGFVYKSSIEAIGDVEIGTEVVESRISLEGTFEMSRGKMLASKISARGGARIYRIGSVKALSSTITVGPSPYLKGSLKTLNKKIEQSQITIDNATLEKEAIQENKKGICRELARMEEETGSGTKSHGLPLGVIRNKIIELTSEKLSLERQERRIERDLEKLQEEMDTHMKRKSSLDQKFPVIPPRPILDVRGKILAGTTVKGLHSSTTITQDLARVRILEMSTEGNRAKKGTLWEMATTRL